MSVFLQVGYPQYTQVYALFALQEMVPYKGYNMLKNDLTKVRKVGGAHGIIIPVQFLRALKVGAGDNLGIVMLDESTLALRKITIIT